MIPAERRKLILELIAEKGSASIAELSESFSVSEMTIHRDLHFLEASGFVQKTHGGAIVSPYTVETDYARRAQVNKKSKEKIGKASASLINDGDSILIDASSTSHALIPFLNNFHELTIFTTSIHTLSLLALTAKFELHSTGGMVYGGTDSFIGPSATNYLDNIHVDKCFMGAAGISAHQCISGPIPMIIDLKKHMAQAASEVVICIDQTKFGRSSRFNILSFEEIDLVVTDAEEDTLCVEELKEKGVEFLFC